MPGDPENTASVPLKAPKPHVAATERNLSKQASSSFGPIDNDLSQLSYEYGLTGRVRSPQPPLMPDMTQWYVNQTSTPESLAMAYGATHGQPNAEYGSIDWLNNTQSPYVAPQMTTYTWPQHQTFGGRNSFATAQLQQQLAQLQLQQQQDHVALQQQMLLAQIQAAQELRAKADLKTAMQAQHARAQTQKAHELPQNPMLFGSSPRRGLRNNTPIGHARSPMQLPEDVTKAMSAVSHIRQVEQSRRESSQSPQQSGSRGERRSLTPSIVIDGSHVPNQADAISSASLRAGSPQPQEPRYAQGRRSPAPRETSSKRTSMNEIGVGRAPMLRSEGTSRPKSLSAAGVSQFSALVHHPRRQPRGPPMESFFANNFLARRSIRTRREAMSKLVASPRAPSFGNAPLPATS